MVNKRLFPKLFQPVEYIKNLFFYSLFVSLVISVVIMMKITFSLQNK